VPGALGRSGRIMPPQAGGPVAEAGAGVPGAQARRAVAAVAPVAERCDAHTAVLACEALVLGGPADGCACGSKK